MKSQARGLLLPAKLKYVRVGQAESQWKRGPEVEQQQPGFSMKIMTVGSWSSTLCRNGAMEQRIEHIGDKDGERRLLFGEIGGDYRHNH